VIEKSRAYRKTVKLAERHFEGCERGNAKKKEKRRRRRRGSREEN